MPIKFEISANPLGGVLVTRSKAEDEKGYVEQIGLLEAEMENISPKCG